nr:hypothetical protein CFP56_11246 [Quercus suber]
MERSTWPQQDDHRHVRYVRIAQPQLPSPLSATPIDVYGHHGVRLTSASLLQGCRRAEGICSGESTSFLGWPCSDAAAPDENRLGDVLSRQDIPDPSTAHACNRCLVYLPQQLTDRETTQIRVENAAHPFFPKMLYAHSNVEDELIQLTICEASACAPLPSRRTRVQLSLHRLSL